MAEEPKSVYVTADDGELTFDRSDLEDGETLVTDEPTPITADTGSDTPRPPSGTSSTSGTSGTSSTSGSSSGSKSS